MINKTKFNILLSFLLLLILNNSVFSSSVERNAGTAGAVFLRLGVGVRAIGMGGVYTSIPDGSNSTYGNAAGVMKLQTKELTVMYSEWFADINYSYTSYAQPLSDKTGISASVIYVDYGSFEGRGNLGERIDDPTASDMAIALTYGGRIRDNILLGTNIKFIQEKLAGYSANAYSFDIGALYFSKINNLVYGVSIQNIGTKIKFENESFNLPLTFRTGLSYYALQNKLIMAFDFVKARDTKFYYAYGIEYNLYKTFSIRTGYTLEKDIGNGYSFGAGINTYYFNFDYAYSPYGKIGDTHRLSFTLKL